MHLVIKHLNGPHELVILGDEEDAKRMREYGFLVVGFISGEKDKSGTLVSKIESFLTHESSCARLIYGWGWRSATVLSSVSTSKPIMSIVDEIDNAYALNSCRMTLVTPSKVTSDVLISSHNESLITSEPLLGLKPISIVLDKNSVRNQLRISNELTVTVLGSLSSPDLIADMLIRLDCAKAQVVFVLPPQYKFQPELVRRLKALGLMHRIRMHPPNLRPIDLLGATDVAWAPNSPSYDRTTGVLSVIQAAWEGVPLAISPQHPSRQIPLIGKRLAWAEDELDICAWLLGFENNHADIVQRALDLAHRVRTLASPTRFIDGLLMRIPSAARF